LKVSANVKIAMQYIKIFGGANAPSGCAPVPVLLHFGISFAVKTYPFQCKRFARHVRNALGLLAPH